MSLKIIFIPVSLILVLVLCIGYIKPDYDTYLSKGAVYDVATQQLNQVKTRQGQITSVANNFSASFSDTLGGKNEEEALMDQYVPSSTDQDRVVDALNYLAGQSGVLISSLIIEKPAVSAVTPGVPDQAMSSQAVLLGGAGTATSGDTVAPAIALKALYPDPKAYQATLAVTSNYASLVNFFNMIYHMNRENEIKSFTLKKDAGKQDDQGNVVHPDFLSATVVVSFMYYPGLSNMSIQNVEALPVFSSGKLDTKAFDYIKSKTENHDLPALSVGEFSARENPFLP